jgi:hypothetical protein
MRPALYTVNHPGPGQLSTMAKPRGGDWLHEEMTALKTAGVDVLVCALTPPELHETGLGAEARAAREAGLHFVAAGHYATETFGIRALGEHLAERFGLRHVFLDIPNPI